MAWESQDDGFIAKILLQEGAKDIPVGTPAMIFVEEEVCVSAPAATACVWCLNVPASCLFFCEYSFFHAFVHALGFRSQPSCMTALTLLLNLNHTTDTLF